VVKAAVAHVHLNWPAPLSSTFSEVLTMKLH